MLEKQNEWHHSIAEKCSNTKNYLLWHAAMYGLVVVQGDCAGEYILWASSQELRSKVNWIYYSFTYKRSTRSSPKSSHCSVRQICNFVSWTSEPSGKKSFCPWERWGMFCCRLRTANNSAGLNDVYVRYHDILLQPCCLIGIQDLNLNSSVFSIFVVLLNKRRKSSICSNTHLQSGTVPRSNSFPPLYVLGLTYFL